MLLPDFPDFDDFYDFYTIPIFFDIFRWLPRVGKKAALKKINEISHKFNLSWIFCFAVNRVAGYKKRKF